MRGRGIPHLQQLHLPLNLSKPLFLLNRHRDDLDCDDRFRVQVAGLVNAAIRTLACQQGANVTETSRRGEEGKENVTDAAASRTKIEGRGEG